MGLFSKKPKSIIVKQPATKAVPTDEAMDRLEQLLPMVETLPQLAPPPPKLDPPAATVARTPAPAPKLAPAAKPPKPAKKNKKFSVDPADFLALRKELIDMKARLDESEQARAMVESRLTSLDAAASAFTTERNDITEIANMVIQLQQQIADGGPVQGAPDDAGSSDGRHDELSAKIDAIQNRLFGLTDHSPKIAEFEEQIGQLRGDLSSATTAAADNASTRSTQGPHPETLERIAAVQQRINELDEIRHRLGDIDHLKQRMNEIDALHERVAGVESVHERISDLGNLDQRLASVDGLAMQLQQLNARVAAQAELGGQLSALRDRVAQLGEQPRGTEDDVRLQLQEIGERLRSNEQLQAQVAQLLERAGANDTEARAVREHMAMLDQRLTNVSTELANQLSELGRDIDGLGQRAPEPADGAVNDEVVDALRGGQVKLANEQARYEIAFREDLAALAELLKRGRSAN
jgi:hypothetical protein